MSSPARFVVRCFAHLLSLSIAAAAHAAPDAEDVILQARAFQANEKILEAVTSVRFVGDLETERGISQFEAIAQKPSQYLMRQTLQNISLTTGMDGYTAWTRAGDNGVPTALSYPQLKKLRALLYENLFFYRGAQEAGGRAFYSEERVVDGVICNRLGFDYGGGIVYYRYFDRDTGQLRMTETDEGHTIRESGEMRVKGIRFPTMLSYTQKGVTQRLKIREIYVNEEYPAQLFAFPPIPTTVPKQPKTTVLEPGKIPEEEPAK